MSFSEYRPWQVRLGERRWFLGDKTDLRSRMRCIRWLDDQPFPMCLFEERASEAEMTRSSCTKVESCRKWWLDCRVYHCDCFLEPIGIPSDVWSFPVIIWQNSGHERGWWNPSFCVYVSTVPPRLLVPTVPLRWWQVKTRRTRLTNQIASFQAVDWLFFLITPLNSAQNWGWTRIRKESKPAICIHWQDIHHSYWWIRKWLLPNSITLSQYNITIVNWQSPFPSYWIECISILPRSCKSHFQSIKWQSQSSHHLHVRSSLREITSSTHHCTELLRVYVLSHEEHDNQFLRRNRSVIVSFW